VDVDNTNTTFGYADPRFRENMGNSSGNALTDSTLLCRRDYWRVRLFTQSRVRSFSAVLWEWYDTRCKSKLNEKGVVRYKVQVELIIE
jgi:hypothetical protein